MKSKSFLLLLLAMIFYSFPSLAEPDSEETNQSEGLRATIATTESEQRRKLKWCQFSFRKLLVTSMATGTGAGLLGKEIAWERQEQYETDLIQSAKTKSELSETNALSKIKAAFSNGLKLRPQIERSIFLNAIVYEASDIVKFLLKKGSLATAYSLEDSYDSRSALTLAIRDSSPEIIDQLIDNGAVALEKDDNFLKAAFFSNVVELFDRLLEAGAKFKDPNSVNSYGQIYDLVKKRRSNFDPPNKRRDTILTSNSSIKYLLDQNLISTSNLEYLFGAALKNNDIGLFNLLLTKVQPSKEIILKIERLDSPDLIRALFKNKPEIKFHQYTDLKWVIDAFKNNDDSDFEILKKGGVSRSVMLPTAFELGSSNEFIDKIINGDTNLTKNLGGMSLRYAIRGKNKRGIAMILDEKKCEIKDPSGVLLEAAKTKDSGFVKILVDHGLNVGEYGSAALEEAIKTDNKEMKRYLLTLGATIRL